MLQCEREQLITLQNDVSLMTICILRNYFWRFYIQLWHPHTIDSSSFQDGKVQSCSTDPVTDKCCYYIAAVTKRNHSMWLTDRGKKKKRCEKSPRKSHWRPGAFPSWDRSRVQVDLPSKRIRKGFPNLSAQQRFLKKWKMFLFEEDFRF